MLSVATVNVNGVRAADRKGMHNWLEDANVDVLLLQEVRASDQQLAAALGDGWDVVAHASVLKGRAGVAVAARERLSAGLELARLGVHTAADAECCGDEPDVDTGRWVETTLTLPGVARPLTIVSAYLHSGEKDTQKQEAKMAHLKRVDRRLAELARQAATGGPEVLVAGDFNVVRTERDIKNWKPNHNKRAGVLDEEIAHLDHWFDELGLVDVQRELVGPDVQGPYSWWSWRGQAFTNDAGWRIDYHMASPGLAATARTARVDKASEYALRFSDHAPVVVEYEVAALT